MIGSRQLRRISWFGVVGVASTALYAAGAATGVELFGRSRMAANTFGFLLATSCSYLGHHYLTFRSDGDHRTYIPRFLLQAVVTYFLASAVTWLVAQLGVHYSVGIIFVVTLIPLLNYVVLVSYVFAAGKS
jgi:putative flippase GtrA